jgi:hypothetical protein
MRMQQPLARFEEAFEEQITEEEERRMRLRQEAAERSRERQTDRVHKRGNLRFLGLLVAIILTAVLVTRVMFEMLTLLMGP